MNNRNVQGREVVYGHEFCQTEDAKWLCLEDIYQKFHRPNAYDIGGTYIDNVPDYWFIFITKQVASTFLLELLITSYQEGRNYNVAVSSTNQLMLDHKKDIVYLDSTLKDYQVKRHCNMNTDYLTTYDFSKLDVEMLKDKKLYIPVSFNNTQTSINKQVVECVKCGHDFGALLEDPIGADFTIESSDGEKFEVHKILLAAQSEVFKAMLKEETAECQNSYVKLIDVSQEDLKCLLEFIYTGTVKDLETRNCFNLLMLADRFNLNGLKVLTQHALVYQLSNESALEILVLADMYNSSVLKTAALKYIKKYASVLDHNVFNEINNVDLVRELCRYLAA